MFSLIMFSQLFTVYIPKVFFMIFICGKGLAISDYVGLIVPSNCLSRFLNLDFQFDIFSLKTCGVCSRYSFYRYYMCVCTCTIPLYI